MCASRSGSESPQFENAQREGVMREVFYGIPYFLLGISLWELQRQDAGTGGCRTVQLFTSRIK